MLIARFILDLRCVYYLRTSSPERRTTLWVAGSSIIGNLAAPVGNSTWITSPNEDLENVGLNHHEESKQPFRAGVAAVDANEEFSLENLRYVIEIACIHFDVMC